MSDRLLMPVVVILFNRPDRVRQLVDVLRQHRPTRVFAVADGPRPDHLTDAEACRAARQALDAIDWPCEVTRDYSDHNLGCDRRLMSGLDWTFARTDRAVILEDDVLPHRSFLPWATRMLERFHDDEEVAMVSGHNLLGHWGDATQDHVRTRRGSVWGWATTASAWQQTNALDLSGDPADAARDVAQLSLDPLVAAHHAIALESYRRGTLRAWDLTWSLRMAFRRSAAIVSSINLVRNTGIGHGATRTTYADDLSALVPAGEARTDAAGSKAAADAAFDRAALLVQLLARCVAPSMAWRLARSISRGATLPLDATARLYLAPFTVPVESLAVLEHLSRQGVTSPAFETLIGTMRNAATASAVLS